MNVKDSLLCYPKRLSGQYENQVVADYVARHRKVSRVKRAHDSINTQSPATNRLRVNGDGLIRVVTKGQHSNLLSITKTPLKQLA